MSTGFVVKIRESAKAEQEESDNEESLESVEMASLGDCISNK